MSNHGNVKAEVKSAEPEPKPKGKRGRKKKIPDAESVTKTEAGGSGGLKQELITDHLPVVKKKRKIDRFNGMPEEEVLLRLLPDRLAHNLDILIIGINPGLFAAYIGHHYAGPGNHFWKCLYLSGLVPEPMNCYDDIKLLDFGIGFTNMCARTTRGSADLKRKEIEEGGVILREKLKEYNPKIAVFNGKGIYEVFSGNKKMKFGKQAGLIEGTSSIAYVMPSSSARCAQLPRAIDKVPFYAALGRLRDYVKGHIPHLDEADVTFPTLELKTAVKKKEPEMDAENKESTNSLVPGAGDGGGPVSSSSDPACSSAVKKEAAAQGRSKVKKETATRGRGRGKGKKKADQADMQNGDVSEGVSSTGSQDISETNNSLNNPTAMSQVFLSQPAHPQVSLANLWQQGSNYMQAASHSTDSPLDLSQVYQGQQTHSQAPFTLLHQGSNPVHQTGSLIPNGFAANTLSAVNFSSLQNHGPSFLPPMLPRLPFSPDSMSGLYAGSHGLVGFPGAVACQPDGCSIERQSAVTQPLAVKSEPGEDISQQRRAIGDQADNSSVKIKSEPVEVDA